MSRLLARHMPGCDQMYWRRHPEHQSMRLAGHEGMHGDCHDARHPLVSDCLASRFGWRVIGT
jgi:hypothetical protein